MESKETFSKTIVCGKENLDGKLVPAPLDEKNITTDWIEDFLFDRNCAKANADARYCGFLSLKDDTMGEMLCDLWYRDNCVEYLFPCCNYIDDAEIEYFCDHVADYFADDEFTVKVKYYANDTDLDCQLDYKPKIQMYFYFRDEVEKA